MRKRGRCIDCGALTTGKRCQMHFFLHRYYSRAVGILMGLIGLMGIIGLTAAPLQPQGKVTLAFEYPQAQMSDDTTFQVYASTNISLPLTNWVVLTNLGIFNTNLVWLTNGGIWAATNTANVTVQIQPGAMFFVATSSNFWGKSDFSNVTNVPALPVSGSNWRAIKAN